MRVAQVTLPSVPLPDYQFPMRFMLRWLWDVVVRGRKRNLGVDGLELSSQPAMRSRVLGIQWLPVDGPCVLVMNHYERPGLRVWRCASLVTAAVWQRRGHDPAVRWLIADRFSYRLARVPVPAVVIAWLLRMVARTYQLLRVARYEDRQVLRSGVLLEARRALRRGQVLGVTPEAGTKGGPELKTPWPNSAVTLAWALAGQRSADPRRLLRRRGGPPRSALR